MSFEERLRDELQRTAAALPSGSIKFNEVLERGHRARRRGIAMMAAAAAVVVALAVGGATVLIGDNGPSGPPIPPGGTESPPPSTDTPTPSPEESPTETPSEEGVSFEEVEPTVREWLLAIQNSDEDAAWDMMTPEAQAEVGRARFDQDMQSALPEGMGAFANAPDFHYVVVASGGTEAAVVAVLSGEVEREGSVELDAEAISVRIRTDEVLIDETFDGDYFSTVMTVFTSASGGPTQFHKGKELTVELPQPEGVTNVYVSIDDDEVPLPTDFDPQTGAAVATLDRDLEEGFHIATIVLERGSEPLYSHARIFETASP
jgi:hypothetical protein